MKKWYHEEYEFQIEVIGFLRGDHTEQYCRNGEEIGDTYTCTYGCPVNAAGQGICSKVMMILFSVMEAVRSGGDLENIGGNGKYCKDVVCPDGCVIFRLTAKKTGNENFYKGNPPFRPRAGPWQCPIRNEIPPVKGATMNLLKIALLQIAPCGALDGNLEKGLDSCKQAKEMGADIALFPEMWSNGYDIYHQPLDCVKSAAISANGDFVHSFGNAAKELQMAIGITFLERYGDGIRNSLVLFDRFGVKQLTYAKVHTCDFDVERHLTPGEDFYVTALDTACGTVQVGAMICFDREFPESARILMLKGAELILVPNACPMEINRLSQLRGRAYENMLAIATCNYPETVPDCNGGSSVFDGVAYLPEEEHSRDTCILQAGGQEGIYLASLNLDQLRSYRQQEVHGNAYRHPKKYGLLVDRKIDQPFVRDDYRE